MSGKRKGNQFERSMCALLSRWWTGDRDDVFWRTAGSGGRATRRGVRGQDTKNHGGDVCATDPVGQPLIDLVSIELKRGYNKATVHDCLDKPNRAKKTVYEAWVEQASSGARLAGSAYWLIVHQRDRRLPLALLPSELWDGLETAVESVPDTRVWALCVDGRPCHMAPLQLLLRRFPPAAFAALAAHRKKLAAG